MQMKVQKWGNGSGVRFTKEFLLLPLCMVKLQKKKMHILLAGRVIIYFSLGGVQD